jgi:FtsH-binding integral membrane protein
MNEIIDNNFIDEALNRDVARKFIARVYTYMFFGLFVTGAIAYVYGNIGFVSEYLWDLETGKQKPLLLVVTFAPVGIALAFNFLMNRLSFVMLFALYALYSILLGFALTSIFIIYSGASIGSIFGVTAITFGIMAIAGYTTKADLTKMGSILGMIFVGMFVTSIVNFFLGSDLIGYILSMLGVVVFTGLTAYHMQRLKELAYNSQLSEDQRNKLALDGGFTLYVLFINLFLSLLRLFGSRD